MDPQDDIVTSDFVGTPRPQGDSQYFHHFALTGQGAVESRAKAAKQRRSSVPVALPVALPGALPSALLVLPLKPLTSGGLRSDCLHLPDLWETDPGLAGYALWGNAPKATREHRETCLVGFSRPFLRLPAQRAQPQKPTARALPLQWKLLASVRRLALKKQRTGSESGVLAAYSRIYVVQPQPSTHEADITSYQHGLRGLQQELTTITLPIQLGVPKTPHGLSSIHMVSFTRSPSGTRPQGEQLRHRSRWRHRRGWCAQCGRCF